jgi:tRNA 2-selenouridine synthase
LGEIGWNALQLEGGYKGFRQTVVADLARFCDVFQFRVLCGPTGSGKSALLRAMSDFAQVLDLESLARHRGSLLGAIDDVEQPAQKAFETALWQTLRGFDAKRPVFVESEGARIGRLSLPLAFTRALRSSPCVVIETPDVLRIAHLLVQYPAWQKAPDKLSARLMALVGLHSRAKVARWQAMIAERSWTELVAALLHDHYDPAYRRSLESEFVQLKSAKRVRLDSFDAVSLLHAAHEISALGETGALAPSAAPKAHAETSAAR